MANLITAQEVIELAFAENSNMREESISDTSIRIAEIKYIKPVFGNMYSMLGTTYATFTNEYLKPALAYFVKCEIVSSIAIDMSNSGIAVANPQYQSAASDKQRQRLYDSEMSKAKVLLDDALAYISAHAEEFPDFVGTAPKKHYRNGGLILGGGASTRPAVIVGDAVSRKDFDALENRVEDLEKGGGGSTSDNNYTDADKALVERIPEISDKVEEVEHQLATKVDYTTFDNLSNDVHATLNTKADKSELDSKQDTIDITTKSNGNIVLLGKEFMPATPSGDPMHKAYEAEGAVWNATTGYWEMYDMTDITNEEMRKVYNLGHFNTGYSCPLYASGSRSVAWVRFNLPRTGAYALYMSSGSALASTNARIEFINLCPFTNIETNCQMLNMQNSFYRCTSLRKIFGIIEMSLTTNTTDTFKDCSSLVDVTIKNLKQNISFADSPLLSKESLLYMIENCASNAAFTITLHPEVYAKCTDSEDGAWYDDITNAIDMVVNSKNTTITLASA